MYEGVLSQGYGDPGGGYHLVLSLYFVLLVVLGNCIRLIVQPRLHERFFACDGDAIFSKFVASAARGENHTCSHPRASAAMATVKNSREIQ